MLFGIRIDWWKGEYEQLSVEVENFFDYELTQLNYGGGVPTAIGFKACDTS